MFNKILIPLDGSDHSGKILHQVRRLLLVEDAEIELFGAVVPLMDQDVEKLVTLRLTYARRQIGRFAEELGAQGVTKVSQEVVMGDPAAEILRRIERTKPDLVAMATHGRSGISRWVRGSVTERVLRQATAPMLVINPEREEGHPQGINFRRIVVALDGSERAEQVLPLVENFAKLCESEVVLTRIGYVHPADFPYPDGEAVTTLEPAEIERSLQRAKERLSGSGVNVRTKVGYGDPADELLKLAEEEDADLVALTTHGYSGVDRWLFGSVAESVIRSCPIPLLLLRTAALPGPGAAEQAAEQGAES